MALQEEAQVPVVSSHVCPEGQLPQLPPQLSSPQVLPVQSGVQPLQVLLDASQVWPAGQFPQETSAQPLLTVPHSSPVQAFGSGTQVAPQVPVDRSQTSGEVQVPQLPLQPSSPQSLPVQSGTQVVEQVWVEVSHTAGEVQLPQLPPQPLSPQSLPVQSGVQAAQVPVVSSQILPDGQFPQLPPQPSSPQVLPVQSGVQPPSTSGTMHTLEVSSQTLPLLHVPHEMSSQPLEVVPHSRPEQALGSGSQALSGPPSLGLLWRAQAASVSETHRVSIAKMWTDRQAINPPFGKPRINGRSLPQRRRARKKR
jgi:hypothetical protein